MSSKNPYDWLALSGVSCCVVAWEADIMGGGAPPTASRLMMLSVSVVLQNKKMIYIVINR
jgi:hypothetical protein